MNSLHQRISLLPKDLQIIIGEYDVEHRPKMQKILNEIKQCESFTYLCFICQTIKIGICHISNEMNKDKKIISKRCCTKNKSSPYEIVHFKGYKTMRLFYS